MKVAPEALKASLSQANPLLIQSFNAGIGASQGGRSGEAPLTHQDPKPLVSLWLSRTPLGNGDDELHISHSVKWVH